MGGRACRASRRVAARRRGDAPDPIQRPCVCVLRVDGTWHADRARVGECVSVRGSETGWARRPCGIRIPPALRAA
eukprot:3710274-Prymnesium_polylepis.1